MIDFCIATSARCLRIPLSLSLSIFSAQVDNYIIFGFFTILGVAGVVLMLFIVPINKKKVNN